MKRRRKIRSRLNRVKKQQAGKTIFTSFLFLVILLFILGRYGIPLLIKMAVFISENTGSDQTEYPDESAILSAPVLDALPEATPSATIRVTGFGSPNTTLSLLVNGRVIDEILLPQDGSFSLPVQLKQEENIISARISDEHGNHSPKSSSWTVIKDSVPPPLETLNPTDNSEYTGSSQKNIDVQGSTSNDSQIYLNGRFVIVSSDGNFSTKYELQEGENVISIVARDHAGNETVKNLTIHYRP